ncbi:TauD/TfdA family dioxygenase [Streptomyces sp. PT12]|uniref:TauD/TfdA family dioxygenase n=1 Tax=Streptomyces sp. PT12 TaxID=1510197 RepID=UPI000DE48E83|nr:TauD/TfdA family dioxygenase [Streptomyces sp. PT12]RBM11734.1 hypothetical protein DEH69_20765 [Streptomyces sp. PT12]
MSTYAEGRTGAPVWQVTSGRPATTRIDGPKDIDEACLRTRQLRPGVIRHPSTGAEVWFNHLAFWNEWALDDRVREALLDEFGPDGLPFNSAFGDGEPLTREDLRTIQAAYEAATVREHATVREQWEVGDLLLVDNILAAHGRDAFRGERKIVVAMGNPVDIDACRPSTRPAATSV